MLCRRLGPALWAVLVALSAEAQPMEPIYPPALQPGDTIAVVAPSGFLDRERIERAARRLEEMGFRVRIPEGLYAERGYLAGDDDHRARLLMDAFRDPEVDAVFPGAGGFGSTRMLDKLDYDVIRENPKILIGFSDVTGLHLAIQKKTGLVTFHGPLLMYGLGGEDGLTEFSARYYWRALLSREYFDDEGEPLAPGWTYEITGGVEPMTAITPGVARGRLTGGNLSLVCPLMGTPYEIETDDRILFLEDVDEEPYRIDRYLSQLRLAGKLDRLAGVLLGQFSGCNAKEGKKSLTLEEVFRDYFGPLGVPVLMNFPAGHAKNNATLPINAMIEIDADLKRVTLLENPVTLTPPSKR